MLHYRFILADLVNHYYNIYVVLQCYSVWFTTIKLTFWTVLMVQASTDQIFLAFEEFFL